MFGFFSVRLYSIFSLKVKTKKDNKERGKIINYLVTISVKKNVSRYEKKAGKEKKREHQRNGLSVLIRPTKDYIIAFSLT